MVFGTFSSVFRVVGFSYGIYLLELFALIPAIAPLISIFIPVMVIFAVWIGVATAHDLKDWRSLVLPVVHILVILLSLVVIYTLTSGLNLTFG